MKELDTKQRAFVVYLSKILKCKEGDELNKKIQELPSDQLNYLSISFEKIYNTQMDGTIIAKLGAKLNYIKKLNNKCPEGYEVEMFKAGGKPCMRCKKMQEGAIPVAAHKNGKVINDIKSEIAKDKCGGKAKKKKKMECGGKTKSMSCGSKMQNGGKYDGAEHNRLIKAYQAGKIKQDSPEHRRLQELNRSPQAGHDESATEGPSKYYKKNSTKKSNAYRPRETKKEPISRYVKRESTLDKWKNLFK